jgi:hypothetical protein
MIRSPSLCASCYVRFAMQTLNTLAASPESARGLIDTLSDFDAELIHDSDGSCEVKVTLDGSDQEIVAVLNALERHVTNRARSARITFDGHEYVMHPEPAAEGLEPGTEGPSRFRPVLAAGVGFEPTGDLSAASGFQDRPVRPLRHPAV